MLRSARWLAAVVGVAVAAPALAQGAVAPPPQAPPSDHRSARTLRVSGEGRAQTAPDVAVASFAVTALDASLAKATQDATAAARRVLDVLDKAGVAKGDVQTARYDVQIERRAPKSDEPPRITGYRVTNEVRVKVRDLSKLGGLLDRVVAAGANEVQGLAFLKDDPGPERSRALASAVKDARAKAEDIARAAGVRLGEVLEIVEGGRTPGPVPMPRMMAMAASGDVPVQPGEVEISARVEVVFSIL